MATVGTVFIDVKADTTHLFEGMKKAQTQMKQVGESAKDLAKVFGGLVIADFLKNQIKQSLDFADSLNKLSQKTGISADGLYSLNAAAKLSDVNFEDMSKSLSKFSKSIGENSSTFDTLGISIKNNDGTLKNSFDLLGELSNKFSDMPDGASKATLAMQLFGKSGTAMIPLLNGGRDALKEFSGVMSNDIAKSAERFNDSTTRLGLSIQGVFVQAIGDYLPTLDKLSKTFEDMSKSSSSLAIKTEVLRGIYDITSSSFYAVRDAMQSANEVYQKSSLIINDIANDISTLGTSGEDAQPKLNFFQFLATDIQVMSLSVKVVSNTVNAAINDFMNLGNEVDILIAKSKNFLGAGSKENDVKIAQLESWIAQRNMQNADMALQEAELAKQIQNYQTRSNYENMSKITRKYLDDAKANLYDLKLLSGEVVIKGRGNYGLPDESKVKAYEDALIRINDAINKNSFTAYEYGLTLIDKEVAEYEKAGIKKNKINEYVFNAKMELGIKQLAEETKQKEEYIKQLGTELTDATKKYQTYYETMGDYATSWEIKRLELAQEYSMLNEEQLDGFLAKQQQSYIKSFEKQKSEAELAAEAMYQAFHGIERQLTNSFMDFFDYTSKGFGDFGALAKNVLNQVIAEMIRMSIVAPIVGRAATATTAGTGLTGLFGGLFANGGAFDNGIQAFATGGVVSSPTLFPMAKGTGLMGEAGPEAIMPLTRIGGSLGVKATGGNTYINVQNESGMPVDMKELSRTQNDRGDEVINIVMKAAVYNPDFRAALGMSR